MRIVIDLQGSQSNSSRDRGIGRYSLALARAMATHCRGHDFWITLNGRFPNTILPIRKQFEDLLPPERLKVFNIPTPIAESVPANSTRRRLARTRLVDFLQDLNPDFVHVSSLFEGLHDDAISAIEPLRFPTAVTLYDLIPLVHAESYLRSDQLTRSWYYRKLQELKRANVLLAISAHSRRDAIERLSIPEDLVMNIGAGLDAHFQPIEISLDQEARIRNVFGLSRRFVMYTGGMDWRKNIERLIEGFALLPSDLRDRYQLAIVCSATEQQRQSLIDIGAGFGLQPTDIIVTGFVSDTDLVALYNLCELFIFPSLNEGFGLPAAEAMACGAPVIGSNTSSIPEVIGRPDALFDPHKSATIAEAIAFALTNDDFRKSLRAHGPIQAQHFTWEEVAKSAIAAIENASFRTNVMLSPTVRLPSVRPTLAYVSPLPPERSGISDYSTELLRELGCHYQVVLIVDQMSVEHAWLTGNFEVRDVAWFRRHAARFKRILYHFGNSTFHKHMFSLLKEFSGIVVLHDFYLGHVIQWMHHSGYQPGAFIEHLFYSHGYRGVAKAAVEGEDAAIWAFPISRHIFDCAHSIIVHSKHSIELATRWYGHSASAKMHLIPHLRALPQSVDRSEARKTIGIPDDSFLVCSFGHINQAKQIDRIIDAFLTSQLSAQQHCWLVFVGENDGGEYGKQIQGRVDKATARHRIKITGYVSPETYHAFLSSADLAVQLRSNSRGETAGSVLDVLAHGVPLIANAHGSMAELPESSVTLLPDVFTDTALVSALELHWIDAERRGRMKQEGRDWVRRLHHPTRIGNMYRDTIEHCVIDAVRSSPCSQPQLLLDISVLVIVDARTGIQRVVRRLMQSLLTIDNNPYRVEPVYYSGGCYHYARNFTMRFLGRNESLLNDSPVEATDGDVFLGLDLALDIVPAARVALEELSVAGVKICFVVYDILPMLRPEWWSPEVSESFSRWFSTIVRLSDTLLSISRATADSARNWFESHYTDEAKVVQFPHFHLGADLIGSGSTTGFPTAASDVLDAIARRPTFLTVGTLEPRKGHLQLLLGFELLWQEHIDVNLIIVGKHGWKVDNLVEKISSHEQMGRKLFWVAEASDEYLETLYLVSSALIAASEAEGFGLPLIEAVRFHVPIIARDIPVFREVLDTNAYYFAGFSPEAMACAIKSWLALKTANKAPMSSPAPVLTWDQSAQQLIAALS